MSRPVLTSAAGRFRYSRRTLLGHCLAAVAVGAIDPVVHAAPAAAPAAEPSPPGAWRTWLLTSGDELRPAEPRASASSELEELRDLQAQRTAATAAIVAKWASGPAILPWTDLTLDLIRVHRPTPIRAARALALLHAALHDAIVASWDAKGAYPRPAPWQVDDQLTVLGRVDAGEASFPSEHAVVAATATTVLAYLFPDEPAEGLAALADEAASSRLWAGASFRSDIEEGLSLGRLVGERAIARGTADGSDAAWDGTGRSTGEGAWQPTPPGYVQQPLDPQGGTWVPWVLASGDALRPAPPPVYRSPSWQAELAAVQDAVSRRTPEQEQAVLFWAGGPGTVTPAGLWTEVARDLIVAHGLDLPHAARVLALTTVAMADAAICCWDAKYAYWTARPITADPDLDVLIPTPPFPSYTSGHASISGAAATVLGHLFAEDSAGLAVQAAEANDSRLWAGIHFPIDCEMGAVGGQQVGRLVVARARTDRSE
jgi:membrane-associated phospholipid phosphatase